MPEAMFLHIQTGQSATGRVLELTGTSVRIGRGSQCEVRLDDTSLAEVQCLLRRRGPTWHIQPVGPVERLALDGRVVESQRSWPVGVPLRVGEHWLTLRAASAEPAPLGSFERPIETELVRGVPRSSGVGPSAATARLPRSAEALGGHERALRARERERLWRARWHSAAEALKARAAVPRVGTASPPPAAPPAPPTPPVSPPTTLFRAPELWDLSRIDPSGAGGPPARARPEQFAGLEASGDDTAAPTAGPRSDVDDSAGKEPGRTDARASEAAEAEAPQQSLASSGSRSRLSESAEAEVAQPARFAPTSFRPEAAATPRPEPMAWFQEGPFVTHTGAIDPEPLRSGWAVAPEPVPPRADEATWPRIHDILARHPAAPPPSRPRPLSVPCPATVARRPSEWRIPGWLGVLPALGAALLSTVAIALNVLWAQDDLAAARLADALLGGETLPPKPIAVEETVATAWWRTTAEHLLLQAVARDLSGSESAFAAEVPALLEAARAAAPLNPAVRLARARLGSGVGIDRLGLSRDVIALRQTGQALLQAGKRAAALKAYRAALELVAGADPSRAPVPPFFDDPRARRFGMPYEDWIGGLLRELADANAAALAFADWSQALPPAPVVALAAYRLCLERSQPDAERAFTLVVGATDHRWPELALAARAEAEALEGRLEAAAATYRQAIAVAPEGLIRRSWWLNLAEVEGRLGRTEAMREAWDQARGPDPRDPVNRRLVEARQRQGFDRRPLLAAPAAGGPRRDEAILRANGP